MRRQLTSKSNTCMEGMEVNAAGISVKVGAHCPGRPHNLPCATVIERRQEELRGTGRMRKLGIPTVLDRLIQQGIYQILNPIFEPAFSNGSYGFRAGKNAQQAIQQAKRYQADGKKWKVLEVIKSRLKECGPELHPEKTKIVYCKDEDRNKSYEQESFDFLGYTFRPRLSMNKYGKIFVNFTPAICNDAANRIRKEIRSWKIHLRSDKNLTDLAKMFRSKVQGWVNYYGRYYKSAMYPFLRNIELYLIRWATRKYKRLRGRGKRAKHWLGRIKCRI